VQRSMPVGKCGQMKMETCEIGHECARRDGWQVGQ
jgi:hypothetical protein